MNKPKQLIPQAEEILSAVGLENLPDDQKDQVFRGLMDHLGEIVVETFSDSITEKQAEELVNLMNSDLAKAEERIEEIASFTPGLYEKIHFAIAQELETLRQSYKKIK